MGRGVGMWRWERQASSNRRTPLSDGSIFRRRQYEADRLGEKQIARSWRERGGGVKDVGASTHEGLDGIAIAMTLVHERGGGDKGGIRWGRS